MVNTRCGSHVREATCQGPSATRLATPSHRPLPSYFYVLPFPATGRLLCRHDWQEAVTAEPEQLDQPTRDRPLDPFRVPASGAARDVVADVTRQLQGLEAHDVLRKRARKAADQRRFEGAVCALICDLIHRHLTDPEGWVSVSLANDDLGTLQRYATPITTKTLPTIIENLARPEMDFLRVVKGRRAYTDHAAAFLRPEPADPTQSRDLTVPVIPARRTVIQAGPRLVSRIHKKALSVDDLGRLDVGEVIVLRREKSGDDERGKVVDYADTPTTCRYREEMRAINEWLGAADLQLRLPNGSHGTVRQAGDLTIDTDNRRLYRGFTRGTFRTGGRLHGGFWQPMSGRMRREWLMIGGESVTTVDLATMSARIVYAHAGIKPAWEDAYSFPGYEGQRTGAKKVFNAALFATKRFSRFPGDAEDDFPRGTAIRDVVDAMLRLHAPIAGAFFKGKGHEVQFVESQILVDVLLALKAKDIAALPVHDALIVAESDAEVAKGVMLDKFREHTKAEGLVRTEGEG